MWTMQDPPRHLVWLVKPQVKPWLLAGRQFYRGHEAGCADGQRCIPTSTSDLNM